MSKSNKCTPDESGSKPSTLRSASRRNVMKGLAVTAIAGGLRRDALADSAQRMDWFSKIGPRDAERHKQVMDLISRGVLHTGEDFDEAAFVFHAW